MPVIELREGQDLALEVTGEFMSPNPLGSVRGGRRRLDGRLGYRFQSTGPRAPASTTTGVRSRNLAIALALLFVSCGGSEDALAPGADTLLADLRVTVKPEGPGGPERVRRVECAILGEEAIDPRCRLLGGLEAGDLDPVPRRAACAPTYGGPGTARVSGELRGARVSAEFDLTDACEIARWRRNGALLGAPGVGHGAP